MTTASFRFDRRARLTRPAEFARVFKAARRSADRYFTVLYVPNELGCARIGFAIAKKNTPLAVGRNRIRRIARESFRHERPTLGAIDIIILSRPAAAQAGNADLVRSLARHWQRLRAVNGAAGPNDVPGRDDNKTNSQGIPVTDG